MRIFIIGIILIITFWAISWIKIKPINTYAFFPLWLGYILTINGLSEKVFSKSLISINKSNFLWFFIISIPLWWLFEFLNIFTKNWYYTISNTIHPVIFFLGGSLFFSIVIPAILSTSYILTQTIRKLKPIKKSPFNISLSFLIFSYILGLTFLFLIVIMPQITFPLLWGGIFLIFEPINYKLGFPSIFKQISKGNWTLPIAIALASLFTGFWWELWNYYSYPKWIYTIPYVDYFKIFEMPILGFIGYPFFGLEVYSFTSFFAGIFNKYFNIKLYLD